MLNVVVGSCEVCKGESFTFAMLWAGVNNMYLDDEPAMSLCIVHLQEMQQTKADPSWEGKIIFHVS
jgi:hypothetical protein